MVASGGMLLTGGASRRMGTDKARLRLDGSTLAERNGALLATVVPLAVEVGPGHSGLPACREDPPSSGPLAAIVAGWRALLARGLATDASVLVVAVDLPMLTAHVLERLAAWPGDATVLPVVGGYAQPLACRWSAEDLADAAIGVAEGEVNLQRLPDRARAILLDETALGSEVTALVDIDAPDDAATLGLGARLIGPDGPIAPGQKV